MCLYSQRYTGSHFLWLSSPHSESAPSLINRDTYPLMHRDEQSGWQAGSYSFLTSAHTVIHRTAGPLPFLLLLLHHLPLSLSTLLSVSFLALFLPSLLFVAHSLSTLVPPTPSPSTPIHWPTLSPSLSLFFLEARVSLLALHTITSIHQLSAYSSLATQLPFLYTMTTTPTILHTHVSLRHPSLTSHPSGRLNIAPHTLVLLPLLLLCLVQQLTPPKPP